MNDAEKTQAGSNAARKAQAERDAVWADRKAAEIKAIKARLASKLDAFLAA